MAKRGNHEGTINQLPSGSWRAQIYVNGQRIGKTFKKRLFAQAWLRDVAYKLGKGLRVKESQITLKNCLQSWLQTNGVSEATRFTPSTINALVPGYSAWHMVSAPAIPPSIFPVIGVVVL